MTILSTEEGRRKEPNYDTGPSDLRIAFHTNHDLTLVAIK